MARFNLKQWAEAQDPDKRRAANQEAQRRSAEVRREKKIYRQRLLIAGELRGTLLDFIIEQLKAQGYQVRRKPTFQD